MPENRLLKEADKISLTDRGITDLHDHLGGGGGGLVNKSGIETTDGNAEAVVTFNTPYANTNYFIQLTAGASGDAVICYMKTGTKTVDGFTLISFDDGGKKETGVPVYWATGPYSNP